MVNFLTVGDDFGDMCLLDRHSHFRYVCDTDVFCMFISKDSLMDILRSNPRELLFLQRRATMRINQTISLRGKVVDAKSTLIQKIKTQLADPKAFLIKINRQHSQRVLHDKNKQKYTSAVTPPPSSQSKQFVAHQVERESKQLFLQAKNESLSILDDRGILQNVNATSLVPESQLLIHPGGANRSTAIMTREKDNLLFLKAEEPSKRTSDLLITPLDLKKKTSDATAPKLSFVDSEDHPPSKQEEVKAEDGSEAMQALLQNPAFDLLNLQRIIHSEEIEKLRVAGEAIKELEMTFTALGTGFQSKLIRSTSLDKEAQEVKYKKKDILSKLIRRSSHFKPDAFKALTSIPTAPFLEDLQADSIQDKTPTKEKVRDFIFSEQNAIRETGKDNNSRKKVQNRVPDIFSHKNIDRQKLLFVARLKKEHLDGSLIEDSSDEADAEVYLCHLRR
jgi:hypothetical protein